MNAPPRKAPVDHEAERAVIGFILGQGENDPAGVDELASLVNDQDFDDPQWQSVMQAVTTLRNECTTVSTAAVAGMLHAWGIAKPSHKDMSRLVLELGTGRATAVSHAQRLRELRRWRHLLELGRDLDLAWQRGGQNLSAVVEQSVGDLTALMTENELPYVAMDRVLRDRVHALKEANGKPVRRILTGFEPLDRLTGGFGEGEMITLAAPTGGGKSAIAALILDLLAHQGVPVLIASAEMQAWEIGDRIMSRASRINGLDIRDNNLGPREFEGMTQTSNDEAYAKLFVMEKRGALTLQRLAQTARSLQRSRGLGLIVVDYIQIISSAAGTFEKGRTREAEVAAVSRGIKSLAGELSVPVLALSQFSRQYQKDNREPELSDLRESGSIEQDSNQVLFLYPPLRSERRTLKLKQAKHRVGEDSAFALLHFEKEFMSFHEKRESTVEKNKQARLDLQQRAEHVEDSF